MVLKECQPTTEYEQIPKSTRAIFKEFRTLKGGQGMFGRPQRTPKAKTVFVVEEDSNDVDDGCAPNVAWQRPQKRCFGMNVHPRQRATSRQAY
eukprot:10291297-Lingulodinium_polyedra.AAC.1